MSIEQVPGTDVQYYLIAFDKDGNERNDDGDGAMSDRIRRAVQDEPVTDVFVISHGWKGDIPAAKDQYGRWIGAMAACTADRQAIRQRRDGFKSLIVGFHWPSLPFGDEEFGMAGGAGGGAGAFAAPAAATSAGTPAGSAAGAAAVAAPAGGPTSVDELVATFVDLYADRIADTPAARAAIETIVRAAIDAPPQTSTLPPHVAEAYRVLNHEAQLTTGPAPDAPGEERAPFDPDRALRNARLAGNALAPHAAAPAFGGFGLSSLLSPLRQLSFWQMKARGRKIGETAGFSWLGDLMRAVPSERRANMRYHLMGHSFGCIVVSSMVNGTGGALLPQPVHSMTLVQGATSLWGFCNDIPNVGGAGYFRPIIERKDKAVTGPIITTQSRLDTAVGRFYPVAAGVVMQVDFAAGQFPKYGGLGAFGIQGPGLPLQDLAIADATHSYGFERGQIYNLECTSVIKDGTGASGAHSDIAKPEVAHAMWEAVSVA